MHSPFLQQKTFINQKIEVNNKTLLPEKTKAFGSNSRNDYIIFIDEVDTQKTKTETFQGINTRELKFELESNALSPGMVSNGPLLPSRDSLSILMEADPIVIKAEYIKENSAFPVEKTVPDLNKYYPLGYDLPKNRTNPALTKKHYRLFLETGLEQSPYMDKNTFDEFIVVRGKRAINDSLFNKLLGVDEEPKAMGIFKCFVEVINEKDKNALVISKNKPLMERFEQRDSVKSQASLAHSKISKKKMDLDKEFMQSAKVIVRVHILEVFNLINLESENVPNPYVKVCLGTEEKDVIQLLKNFYLFPLRTKKIIEKKLLQLNFTQHSSKY